MNSTIPLNSLSPINAIENSSLSAPGEALTGLAEDGFASEFTAAMNEIMSAGGKSEPLDLAALEDLDVKQLTDLAEQMGIQFPPELLSVADDLKHSPLNNLATEVNPSINDVNLLTNPNARELLKAAIVNSDSFIEGVKANSLDNSYVNKTDLFSRVVSEDMLQQTAVKKDPGLTNVLNVVDSDTTPFMKDLIVKDADINREILMQSGRQDIGTIKLTDQAISLDKPTNVINAISNPTATVQPQSNSSTSGLMLLNRVDVPVQQAAWGEAVGNRLIMMVNDKIQSANIHLNPAELGPIEVKININHDQASVHFVSNNSVVRDAIEDAFPRLKEMFSQNGISLSDANVSQQSSQQSSSNSRNEHESQTVSDTDLLETDEPQGESRQPNIIDTGFVDHYV